MNDNNNNNYNGKLQFLLKYLDENNEGNKNTNINTNINSNSINSNNNNNEYIIKKNDSNFLPDTQICVKKNVWEKNSLIITNNISFKYHSSYDNCNILCGGKLVGNKLNQFKLKKILKEEFLFQDLFYRRKSIDPRYYNNKMNININSNLKQSINGKLESPLNNNIQSPFLKQSRKKVKRITSFSCKTLVVNSSSRNKHKFQRTKSFNKNLTESNKLIKQDDTHLSWRKNITISNRNFLSTKNVKKNSHLIRVSNEKSRKKLSKVNSLLLPNNKPKKKKDDLLSKINSNIRKTNQNLNNPDEFYSNYFNSIMNGIPKGDKGNNFMKNFIQKK
jgi:hypothetical protein